MPICCSSQTTYPQKLNDSLIVITPTQLKQTNLIFLEHRKLKQQVKEYDVQIMSYKYMMDSYHRTDSLQRAEIGGLYEDIRTYDAKEKKLNKELKLFKNLTIGGFSIGIISTLIAILR